MNTLYMKITGFDESNNSLLVAFASDATSSQNPEDYTSFAFQPFDMWPDVTDVEEIKKRLATAGLWHAEQQARKESLEKNPDKVNALKALAGLQSVFAVSDLVPQPSAANADVNTLVVV